MDQLMAWDGCDAVINLGIVGRRHLFTHLKNACLAANPDISPNDMNALDEMIIEYERNYIHHVVNLMDRYHKPVVGVSLAKGPEDKTVVGVEGYNYKGVFFPAPEQAVKSLSRMHRYRRWLVREGCRSLNMANHLEVNMPFWKRFIIAGRWWSITIPYTPRTSSPKASR